jgi:hypothetical protein
METRGRKNFDLRMEKYQSGQQVNMMKSYRLPQKCEVANNGMAQLVTNNRATKVMQSSRLQYVCERVLYPIEAAQKGNILRNDRI